MWINVTYINSFTVTSFHKFCGFFFNVMTLRETNSFLSFVKTYFLNHADKISKQKKLSHQLLISRDFKIRKSWRNRTMKALTIFNVFPHLCLLSSIYICIYCLIIFLVSHFNISCRHHCRLLTLKYFSTHVPQVGTFSFTVTIPSSHLKIKVNSIIPSTVLFIFELSLLLLYVFVSIQNLIKIRALHFPLV